MTQKFEVIRQHLGDRLYMPGQEREAIQGDVAHLVANGVLKPVHAKADPKVANKAEPKVQNKAEG